MHIIRSETLGENFSRDKSRQQSWLLARLLAPKSLAKSLAESLGSDYMHDSRQDSLRDSFFYSGDCLSEVRESKFAKADPKWLPCCYKISIKLVVVPMEYIFLHRKKDEIIERNDGMKSKKKRKLNAIKWRSSEVLMNLLIPKKKNDLQRNTEKNVNL